MSDTYVTDPELLNQLNSSSTDYVKDENLLKQLNASTTDASVNLAPQAISAARNVAGPVATAAEQVTRGGLRDVAKVGSILYNNVTPGIVADQILHPIRAARNLTEAYMEGHPWANTTPKQAMQGIAGGARNIGGALAQGLTAPESVFSAPYQMSAYEQEKIRANPTAPQYQTNPYAQQYRGEFPSQGAAGAANTRNALINQPYGGLTPQQQQQLQQDRQRQLDIQKQQQKKQQAQVILQQPPTAQNFIERMTAMSDLYGDVNQG